MTTLVNYQHTMNNVDIMPDIIDEDIQHTVARLFQSRPHHHGASEKKTRDGLEGMVSQALQAERNHWKDRLQLSMQEIDRHHRVLLATQTGLQDLLHTLRNNSMQNTIYEEDEEEEDDCDIDQGLVMTRLLENLKFHVKQLRGRASFNTKATPQPEIDDPPIKQTPRDSQSVQRLQETITQLTLDKEQVETELQLRNDKIVWLKHKIDSLQRQQTKLQDIVSRYNESHSGANFHLKVVETPSTDKTTTTPGGHPSNNNCPIRERTYIEGDQLRSYPMPVDEDAVCKDRLQKNIYSARRSSVKTSVAQCLRCQKLFKPSENSHKSCRFHHKGREIREQFDEHGKLEKVRYKWNCCKKPLEAPGCTFSYHV